MKTLYSLGCSFMCDDPRKQDHPSFLQQFCNKHNYEYHCIARPGATNFAIRLQIDYAIEKRPDLIVIGATSSDRIDIVVDTKVWHSPVKINHVQYQGYDIDSEFDNSQAFIISDTLKDIVESTHVDVPEEKKSAVKRYITDLHNIQLQNVIDACIIRDGLHKLQHSNIPFIFMPGPLFYMEWSWLGNNLWPSDKKQPWDLPFNPYCINNHNPPEAHSMFLKTLEQIAVDKELL
jgi:hypothetical protein